MMIQRLVSAAVGRTFSFVNRQSATPLRTSIALFSSSDSKDEEFFNDVMKKRSSGNNLRQTPTPKSIRELAALYKDGVLDLNPKYQRSFVWKVTKASRLIVTALCNRFVPGVVLHEVKHGKFEVLDGKQRLISLLSFYMAGNDEFLPALHELKEATGKGEKELPLQLHLKDEDYMDFNGLEFKKLSEEHRNAFKAFNVACLVLPPGTDKDDIFLVYEDINNGGEDLTAQQIRRAAFFGPYIELLDELSRNENFQCIRDPKGFRDGKYKICEKEHDRELILRAFAFSRDNGRRLKGKALKIYFNKDLERGLDDYLEKKAEFEFVMRVVRDVFGPEKGAFCEYKEDKKGNFQWKSNYHNGTPIHMRVWEAKYGAVADLRCHGFKESHFLENQVGIVEAMKGLFRSKELDLGKPTMTKHAQNRDKIFSAMRSCLESSNNNAEPRSFPDSASLRQELFMKQGGKCSECGGEIDKGRINDGNYVHLDHKVPYSKGGPSTPDNAALAHRVCNQKKGVKE